MRRWPNTPTPISRPNPSANASTRLPDWLAKRLPASTRCAPDMTGARWSEAVAAIRGCGPPRTGRPSARPDTPGVEIDGQPKSAAVRYRELAGNLARAWALAGGDQSLAELRPDIKFYEEVRVWMGKIEANRRQAEANIPRTSADCCRGWSPTPPHPGRSSTSTRPPACPNRR